MTTLMRLEFLLIAFLFHASIVSMAKADDDLVLEQEVEDSMMVLNDAGLLPLTEYSKNEEFQVKHAYTPEGLPLGHTTLVGDDQIQVASDPFEVSMKKVIGKDNRWRVRPSHEWPNRAHGKLYITWREEQGRSTCSGTLIGEKHVLMAGHCVYRHPNEEDIKNKKDKKVWLDIAKSYFIPAINDCHLQAKDEQDCDDMPANTSKSAQPYPRIKIKTVKAHKQYVKHHNRDYDYAVVILKKDIGYKTGWLGFAELYKNKYENIHVHITGYPGDKQGIVNSAMWTASSKIIKYTDSLLWHTVDTEGGNSGAAMWTWLEMSGELHPVVIGVHTSTSDDHPRNYAVRISDSVFRLLEHWLQ